MRKNVHPVYGTGIRTHDLKIMSLLPLPLDQGSRPLKSIVFLNSFGLLIGFSFWALIFCSVRSKNLFAVPGGIEPGGSSALATHVTHLQNGLKVPSRSGPSWKAAR